MLKSICMYAKVEPWHLAHQVAAGVMIKLNLFFGSVRWECRRPAVVLDLAEQTRATERAQSQGAIYVVALFQDAFYKWTFFIFHSIALQFLGDGADRHHCNEN